MSIQPFVDRFPALGVVDNDRLSVVWVNKLLDHLERASINRNGGHHVLSDQSRCLGALSGRSSFSAPPVDAVGVLGHLVDASNHVGLAGVVD